jgi:DNA-binding NtrC family response regulator
MSDKQFDTPDRTNARGGAPLSPVAVPVEVRKTINVLVVDDEHTLRESCASLLRTEGFNVVVCGRGDEAVLLLKRQRFEIMLIDLYMPQVSGMEILRAARKDSPDSIVILMTGNPSVESSIEGLRAGAWDYLPKPFSAGHLQVLVGRAAHAAVVARESRDADDDGTGVVVRPPRQLLGTSPAFLRAVELARKVSATDASVFISGESGTGKELLAQFIHDNSRRRSRKLVALNCAAIPESLLESEMFGHVEGAFTGAVREKKGLLDVANGGTLFLDELSEMPIAIQAKLLRVIQDGVIRRVGSTKTDAVVNVRFLAATNIDPLEAVRAGKLRRDLHYRLRVVPIHVPPLRERQDDIKVLAAQFLNEFWVTHRGTEETPPRLADAAIDALQAWPWRGNVRELRNVLEHLAVLASAGQLVQPEEVPFIEEVEDGPGSSGEFFGRSLNGDYHTVRERVLSDFERGYLDYVVKKADGNISDAARIAGVDRTTLYRIMEKHGKSKGDFLERPER